MNKKLNVLHVIPTLKKDGAEFQLSELFKQLSDVNVEVFTFDLYEEGDSIINNLSNINVLHTESFFSIFYLNKIINSNNYDLIHSHLPKADLIVGILARFNSRIKHIVSVHAQYGTRDSDKKYKYLFINQIWRYVLNNSSGVIAISEKIKSWLIFEKDVNPKNIKTIHYGVKINERTLKNSKNRTIGMAGRMLPWKGWDKVIETAYYLKKDGIEYNLKLAGSDDIGYLKTIKSMIKKYGIEENVEIHQHYSDIENFFDEIDLFLFLSNSEGFGLVVLEAIENDVAVICSNISPLNEFVKNISGCLVDREDTQKIAELISTYFRNNFEELNKVKTIQKENIINNFSINKSAKNIEKFYINTINV